MTTALSSLIQHQQIAHQNKSGILELKFSITEINFWKFQSCDRSSKADGCRMHHRWPFLQVLNGGGPFG